MKEEGVGAKLIERIEEQPSRFVSFLNRFTLFCSVICYSIIIYLIVFNFELVQLFFTDYTKLQKFITPDLQAPVYITALIFNTILSVNPFAQLVPISTVISFFFGFQRGFLFALLSSISSYILTIYLSRTFGKKVVRKIVGEKNWEKVQVLANEEGVFPFFIAHLFPVFPDSVVAWVAGTTKLSPIKLLIASVIARMPGILLTVLIGSGVIVSSPYITIGVFISLITTSLLLTKYRRQILNLVNQKK